MNAGQCTNVLGLDCKGISLCHCNGIQSSFTAPCTSIHLPNCDRCSDADLNKNHCSYYYGCSCHSECYSEGDCCSDISITQQQCYRKLKLKREACKHGSIRLVGGLTNSTGRLEFCAHGIWGRVCNSLNFWGSDNAKVVCRQLGFPEKGICECGVCPMCIIHACTNCPLSFLSTSRV